MSERPEKIVRPQTSTRDMTEVQGRVTAWLTATLPAGAEPEVSELTIPSGNGMSSETLLFDAAWTEDAPGGTPGRRSERCVMRMRPALDAMPVFPTYDMAKQARIMRLVGERTDVPVPQVLWAEDGEEALGAPFFVMARSDGAAPPDVMPYTIDGWLLKASAEEQQRLQRTAVEVVAKIHSIEAAEGELDFLRLDVPGESALRRHLNDLRALYDWGTEGHPVPVLERGFAALEEHFPADPGPEVISWGDARIGNILFEDFRPTAVLDWEMAATGPRELDLAWMLFLHEFFQDIASRYGFPGIPTLMVAAEVEAQYEALTGHPPRNMEYFRLYSAVRQGVVMARIALRRDLFGEAPLPADLDDTLPHAALLNRLLDAYGK